MPRSKLLLYALFMWAIVMHIHVSPLHAQGLVDFSDLSKWSVALGEGLRYSRAADGSAMIQIDAIDKSKGVREGVFTLKKPIDLPVTALRAGLWVYVAQAPSLKGMSLEFLDAKDQAFAYTLPTFSSWQTGWQYVDTFRFTANEMGRLHPQVGRIRHSAPGLPNLPMRLTGLRFAAEADAQGQMSISSIESDSHNLNSEQYHWALVQPGLRYWMAQTLQRSVDKPFMFAGQLLPNGGDVQMTWELRPGFQGQTIRSGAARLHFDDQDMVAKAQRLSFGDLPHGNYDVLVSMRPVNLDDALPTHWQTLRWHANGESRWVANSDHGRSLHAQKSHGDGYVGWRQTIRVPGPGTYTLHAKARGNGKPRVVVTPMNREKQSVARSTELYFGDQAIDGWVTKDMTFTLPAQTDQVYVDVTATEVGQAWFDEVTLTAVDGDQQLIANATAEEADVLKQLSLSLAVLSSPVKDNQPQALPSSIAVGQVMQIPLPAWADQPGIKRWQITDNQGQLVAQGVLTEAVNWTPNIAGLYHYVATRSVGSLEVDRDERLIGGKTPDSDTAMQAFVTRDQVPSEKDLFGPGHNYFTWSMYENHPEEPEFFSQTKQWIADGRKVGFDLMRIRLDWNHVEPLPGVFDFQMADRVIDEVIRQGGKVILELRFESPQWLDVEHQLSSDGRADIWRHDQVGRIPSIWTPGMLDAITRYTQTAVRRYRNNLNVVGYHVWGLPGSLDWTSVDKPWWGQRVDYSPVAINKFNDWTSNRYDKAPQASMDWSHPDLSLGWRDWIAFRRHGLETFFIDSVLKPIRQLDDRRMIVGYFGLDFHSRRLTESAQTLGWRRHTGGSELYYQIPMQASRALMDTGRTWPHEVHLMTPLGVGLEQATFQISTTGGAGYHWNYYWRNNIRVGQWTTDREAGLEEWQNRWRPLWQQMRDATLAMPPDIAGVTTWSTMQYALRSFFPLRLGDYVTRTAAAMYRDQLWPAWFSEDGPLENLKQFKLIVIPPDAAQVMPQRLIDALDQYVKVGGHIVLFPNAGKWCIDQPDASNVLANQLGWPVTVTDATSDQQQVDLGNSGLPSVGQDRAVTLRCEPGSKVFASNQQIVLTQVDDRLQKINRGVEARMVDGTPAVIRWAHGKGSVVYINGKPEWHLSEGLLASLYQWAGGQRDVNTDKPFVQINHLQKGNVHYLVMHRLPDSYRPHVPLPLDKLEREKLLELEPIVTAKWQLRNMHEGAWQVTDLTDDSSKVHSYTADQLLQGIPVQMHLMQTRVLKLEPLRSENWHDNVGCDFPGVLGSDERAALVRKRTKTLAFQGIHSLTDVAR